MHKLIGLRRAVAAGIAGSLVLTAAGAATVPTGELAGALHWRLLGPYIGGRVTSVAGVASEPNVYYAGYAGGGVWKTDDYGHHWVNITDGYLRPDTQGSVGAIAVAPSDPKVIYVGTGDSAPRNTVLTGHGIYKSTDAGKTWQYLGLGETHIITWILVDPRNPQVVYVGALGQLFAPNAERGVFKSTDGGKTWKKVLYVNDDTGVATMAMDPKNPNVLYASMWNMVRKPWTFVSGGPGDGLYKSVDGGATWTNISHNQGLPAGVLGKIGVAVAPSDPNVVYALVQGDYQGHAGGLFRSTDAGRTWSVVNTSMSITQRAFYYMRVYVDPKDANTIYLPNVNVFTSHDGGKKLVKLEPPHGDNHAFWINPDNPKFLIEGNDGGASVSLTEGTSWSTQFNQPTGQFYHVNLDDQFPYHVYSGQQDWGSWEGPSAVPSGPTLPPVWKSLQGGEMSWLVPEPDKPWVTFGSGYYSLQWAENQRTLLRTNVSAWAEDKFGHKGAAIKYRFGWKHHPVVFAPRDPNELLIGANVVFKSMDGGQNWTVISPDLTRNDKSKQQRPGGPISADVTGEEMYDTLSVIDGSPLNANIIWTGSDDGLVYVTTDGGKNWSKWARPANMPKWSVITSISASATQPGAAYVSASRYGWNDFHPYVFKTTDYGKHWTEITAGLPDDEYVEAVRQDPGEPNLLFAGTSAGVYVSFDAGARWQPLQLNLPVAKVTDIEIQPAQHAVVIGTFGRGIWSIDNLQYLEQLGDAHVDTRSASLFKPQQAWLVSRSLHSFGPKEPGGKNLPAGATAFFYLPPQFHHGQKVTVSFTYPNGEVIRRMEFPKVEKAAVKPGEDQATAKSKKDKTALHAGMNRVFWDLRYPETTEVHGVFHSFFSATKPEGPYVVPGAYDVVLSYGGKTEKQEFQVTLDPRVHSTPAELQAQFDLGMKIYHTIGALNTELNAAIAARDGLQKAIADGKVHDSASAQKVLTALNRGIEEFVDLRIQSDEGALVYPPKLRSWLSAIAGQVSFAFVKPTPAMVQAANTYISEADKGVRDLKVAVGASESVRD